MLDISYDLFAIKLKRDSTINDKNQSVSNHDHI